jgi:tRNA pseudouridine38-40 synthase
VSASARLSERDASEAARSGPLRRVGLGVAYDGGDFHGFADQPGQRTVAGVLTEALAPFHPAERLVCAGRTDAGVHATAQVVHVDLDAEALGRIDPGSASSDTAELPSLMRALNSRLGPECTIFHARTVPENFDARRSALARRYRYVIAIGPKNPLERGRVWSVERSLDVAAMQLAANAVVGEHDFAAFCRRPADRPDASLTRRVADCVVEVTDVRHVSIEIEANAFCHQMVRSIVGMLGAIGLGRFRPSDLGSQLASQSRDGAPTIAPSCGLTLIAVRYLPTHGGTWALGESTELVEPFAPASNLL